MSEQRPEYRTEPQIDMDLIKRKIGTFSDSHKDDLRASTEQHIMDDDIIVGLRAKLAEAEALVEVERESWRIACEKSLFQFERANKLELQLKITEGLAKAREDAWMEIARQNQCNTDYYRGLVVRAGQVFGIAARTQDDGGICEDVLCAKVPELVEQAEANLRANAAMLARQTDLAREAEAQVAALRDALGQWKCSECRGRGEYDYRRSDDKYSIQRCRQCEGTGINPVARAALATPSKAGERYKAMRKVCEVPEDERRTEYPKALIEALDALAKLDN